MQEAVITGEVAPRTYEVKTSEGKTYRRNRKYLQHIQEGQEKQHTVSKPKKDTGEIRAQTKQHNTEATMQTNVMLVRL